MKSLILFIKGILIGIGKIIPGVSGAVLAIILKVYDQGLESITNFFSNPKKNFQFLIKVGLGILIGIILFSKVIDYTLSNYYPQTMLLFVGLIIGGIPNILKETEKKDYPYTIIIIIIFTLLSLTNINNNYILKNNFQDYLIFFLGGILETCGTVIPGLSSTALLLILGIYSNIIESISNLSNLVINYKVLLPFTLGILTSLILISKVISFVLIKYKKKTYSIILGLVISSVLFLIVKTFVYPLTISELLIGLIFMIVGIIISNVLG